MTTIAYRDGVIAADTGVAFGTSTHGSFRKIARNASGDLAGAAGTACYGAAFIQWFEGGEEGPPPEARRDEYSCDRGVIFRNSGDIEVFEDCGHYTCQAPYFAIGSGRPEALGAFFAGADAETAVRAAIASDGPTFGDVVTLSHDQERQGK